MSTPTSVRHHTRTGTWPAPPLLGPPTSTPPVAQRTYRPSTGPMAAQHALLAASLCLALRPLLLLFDPRPSPVVLATPFLALAAAGCGRHLRWSASTIILAMLVALPAAVVALGGALGALISSPAELLTARPPLVPTSELVTVVITVAWLASAAAGALAATRVPVLSVLAPIGLLLTCSLMAAPYAFAEVPWGVASAALAILGVAVARWTTGTNGNLDRREAQGTRLMAAGLLAVAGVVGLSVGVAADALATPRPLREPPVAAEATRVLQSPLASLKALQSDGVAEPLVTVRAHGDDAPRLRLVALDEFDGAHWGSSGVLERSGRAVGGARGEPDRLVTYDVTLSSRYLAEVTLSPYVLVVATDLTVGRATTWVSATGLSSDAAGNVLVVPDGDPPITGYQVRAELTDVELLDHAGLRPLLDDDTVHLLDLSHAPKELGPFVSGAAPPGASPGERLEAVAVRLRDDFAHNPQAAAGHSMARLGRFLSDERSGSAEQFAAAFALAARQAGFPARVVVGFEPPTDGAPGAHGGVEYASAQLTAWPEIAIEDLGWVAWDVLPERSEPAPVEPPAANDEGKSHQVAPTDGAYQDEPELLEDEGKGSGIPTAAVVGLVIVLPLLGGAAAAVSMVLLAKSRRRRLRRRRGDAGDRTLGAWAELRDRMLELGVAVRSSLSPSEQVAVARAHLGSDLADPLMPIIDPVDWAVYDPAGPGDAAAATAWRIVDEYRAGVRRAVRLRRRLLAAADPRPLFLHHT